MPPDGGGPAIPVAPEIEFIEQLPFRTDSLPRANRHHQRSCWEMSGHLGDEEHDLLARGLSG